MSRVRPLRIGYLCDFSPRKLGTGEDRLMVLAQAACERGHRFTLYCRSPVHPVVAAALAAAGAGVRELDGLEQAPLRAPSHLARTHDVVLLNAIAPRGLLALLCYAAWPCKVLFVDHVSGPPDEASQSPRSVVARWLDRATMIRVAQAAGVSEYVRCRLENRFSVPRSRTRTLYGGVDVERFRPDPARPPKAGPVTITVVAALIPDKGIDTLLQALALGGVGEWRLRVAGDGPDAGRLREMSDSLGLRARVEFLGVRDDIEVLLRTTDICPHPARWQEALGYTILEGMASGCSVVASHVGGIPELIRDGVEGLLVGPGDAQELNLALTRLAGDPELRRRLGAAARARVVSQFTLAQNVARTVGWCEEVAGIPQPQGGS